MLLGGINYSCKLEFPFFVNCELFMCTNKYCSIEQNTFLEYNCKIFLFIQNTAS